MLSLTEHGTCHFMIDIDRNRPKHPQSMINYQLTDSMILCNGCTFESMAKSGSPLEIHKGLDPQATATPMNSRHWATVQKHHFSGPKPGRA